MLEGVIGIVMGLAIGAACRGFDVPLPAPPRLAGALLVVAMTLGYLVTDGICQWTQDAQTVTDQRSAS